MSSMTKTKAKSKAARRRNKISLAEYLQVSTGSLANAESE